MARMRTSDGRYEVEHVIYEPGDERLRVRSLPGRYYLGDYRSPEEIVREFPDLDMASLETVDDTSQTNT